MIPGFTSTGSKRPRALFGDADDVPHQMRRAEGCRVWDTDGREYVDTIMALGAVSLGYGHPSVNQAAYEAMTNGVIGPLAPVAEAQLADRLSETIAGVEAVRFFKTGAEAVAGAVRIARVVTGRERIVTCGYHGWLDQFSDAEGVPETVGSLRREVAFNDSADLLAATQPASDVAALVLEPVVDALPSLEWVKAVNLARERSGAILVMDEIKTGLRLGVSGASEHWGFNSDLVVMGKALGNGFPISAVCGSKELMDACERTWISSTWSTEFVSLAAANAVLEVYDERNVVQHLAEVGAKFFGGLHQIAAAYPRIIKGVKGIPQFCYLDCHDEKLSCDMAAGCARGGVLFKRNAYNFVSLAHSEAIIAQVLERVGEVLHKLDKETAE